MEATTTSIITKTQELWLDGRTQTETNPIDNSTVTMTSECKVETAGDGGKEETLVMTYTDYEKSGHQQTITRRLIDGGKVYMVTNEMRLHAEDGSEDQTTLTANTYFNKTD